MADPSLPYVLVDVFARERFAGNQLAVVFDGEDLSTYQLQRIAAEFNLSETTFPIPRTAADTAAGADYRVRIFTASRELPFAGHPTLGTAWVLAGRDLIQPGKRQQACLAGLIEVTIPDDPRSPVELGATPSDVSGPLAEDQAVACAASVGLTAHDIAGETRVAGCGLSWVHLPVVEAALARVRPRSEPMSADLVEGALRDPLIGINVYAVSDAPHAEGALAVRARVFVPGPSVPEDPATGSAAVGLGVALVATGTAAPDGMTRYEIVQGVELGRPSYLSGRVQADGGVATRCWVAGQVKPIGEGTISIPDPQDSPDPDWRD